MRSHRTLTRICAATALLLIGRICSADSNPVDVVRNAVHAGYPDVTIVDVRPIRSSAVAAQIRVRVRWLLTVQGYGLIVTVRCAAHTFNQPQTGR